ncbi:unnamed protein product [Caenorhabditis sp. 36 PRJEB53466]|nr:unnamed protein product [Caenorhabditis sp. 36 PRJEB53466]
MIGYQANGIIRFVDFNLAIPAVFTIYSLLGVAVSIMHLFHFRLNAIVTMNTTPRNKRVLRDLQRLVYLTYISLIFTCFSFLGLLTLESLQPTMKPMIFEKYHIAEVWCPKYLVADPFSWQILVAFGTTIFFTIGVMAVVLLCGGFTLSVLFTARKDLSQHTLRIQKTFTGILIVQAAVHVVFILVPIFCIIVAVYFDIWVKDGGLFFFSVEAQQGTASTLVFIFTHSKMKNLWTVDTLGRNADRLIKKYEHVPAVISLVSFSIGILMFVLPVLLGH